MGGSREGGALGTTQSRNYRTHCVSIEHRHPHAELDIVCPFAPVLRIPTFMLDSQPTTIVLLFAMFIRGLGSLPTVSSCPPSTQYFNMSKSAPDSQPRASRSIAMDESRPEAEPGTLTTIGAACEAARDAVIGRTGQGPLPEVDEVPGRGSSMSSKAAAVVVRVVRWRTRSISGVPCRPRALSAPWAFQICPNQRLGEAKSWRPWRCDDPSAVLPNLSIGRAGVVLAGFLAAQRLAAGTTPPRGRG
ncbi:hypothetical protein QBC39DRAFT_341480 [Podospora conica]|nr:hypothetical protein QBC39DRAFT_341480 [Schizothecium conicum]